VTRLTEDACEVWSVALVDLHRTRLGDCAAAVPGGMEWTDGGTGLIHTGVATPAQREPGLVLLDRRSGRQRVLTTPEPGEGAHAHPRLSFDGTRLVYASMHDGEGQLWQTDRPGLKQRTALLKRPDPVYGHAFEPGDEGLWIAGDLTRYRALHRLVVGGEPELIGGRGARSIDIAADGAQGLAKISAAGGGYDLVVSDIRMPEMDGIEMAIAAAKLFPDMKILLMTGYAEQRERADDLAEKIIDVVAKPFALPDIRKAVARALVA
jgi:CheY-like chemotaxis protein